VGSTHGIGTAHRHPQGGADDTPGVSTELLDDPTDRGPMEEVDLGGDPTNSERPIKILDMIERVTHSKVIKMCKVLWNHHTGNEAT
jgi:hypothetical protein